jgi:hypothetical protein
MKPLSRPIPFLDYARRPAARWIFIYHANFAIGRPSEPAWNGGDQDFRIASSFPAFLRATFGWAGAAIFFAGGVVFGHQRQGFLSMPFFPNL